MISAFYNKWGGRIPLQLLSICFLNLPIWIWRITNTITYTLLAVYLYRTALLLTDWDKKYPSWTAAVLSCLLLWFLPQTVLKEAVFCLNVSFNYLLPVTAMVIGLFPFIKLAKGEHITKLDSISALPCIFLACYAEQTGAVFLVFSLFCLVWHSVTRKVISEWVFYYIFGIINFLIQFSAPGNQIRAESEMIQWYNSYDMLNLMDKLVMGMLYTVRYLFENGFPFILLLSVMILISLGKSSWYFGALQILMVVGMKYLPEMSSSSDLIVDPYDIKSLFLLGIVIFWILLTALCLMNGMGGGFKGGACALFWLALMCSGIIMGFSPTIYASSHRVFMTSFVLLDGVLLLTVVHLLEKLYEKGWRNIFHKKHFN